MNKYTYNELIQIGSELNNHKRISVNEIAQSLLDFDLNQQIEIFFKQITNGKRRALIRKEYNILSSKRYKDFLLEQIQESYIYYKTKLGYLNNEQKCLDMFMHLCKARSDFFEQSDSLLEEFFMIMEIATDDNCIHQEQYTKKEIKFYKSIKEIMKDVLLDKENTQKIVLDAFYFWEISNNEGMEFVIKNHHIKEIREADYSVEYDYKDSQTIIYDNSIIKHNLNAALVQIDFSKSKKEISEYIKKLKDDYDNNQLVTNQLKLIDSIKNEKPYQRKNKHKEIYNLKQGSNKPLHEILGNILLIFDLKSIGLNTQSIKDKAIEDSIFNDTIDNYYKIAVEYINNKKYLNFLISK